MKPETAAAADAFRPARALKTIQRLWKAARRMDSRAIRAAAECVAEELRAAGLDNVRIEELPADGRTAPGGWIMPLAWSVTEARLEIGGRGGEVLADFAANPQTLAMYSPETPHGRWVEGPVVVAADMAAVRRNRLHGTFLFVNDGRTSPDLNALAAQAIALGIIVSVPNPDPNAAQSTHEAHSSVRVQTHCMVMGQGVGTAAALALDGGTELAGIDVATLQARLRADGAYIEDVPRKELPCN